MRIEVEVPHEHTVNIERWNEMLGGRWPYSQPNEQLTAWLKEYMPDYTVNDGDFECILTIDENDIEGRALLKLTWGIG